MNWIVSGKTKKLVNIISTNNDDPRWYLSITLSNMYSEITLPVDEDHWLSVDFGDEYKIEKI